MEYYFLLHIVMDKKNLSTLKLVFQRFQFPIKQTQLVPTLLLSSPQCFPLCTLEHYKSYQRSYSHAKYSVKLFQNQDMSYTWNVRLNLHNISQAFLLLLVPLNIALVSRTTPIQLPFRQIFQITQNA